MYNATIHIITGVIIALTLYMGYEFLYGSKFMSGFNPVMCVCIIIAVGIVNICATFPIESE